MTTSQSRATSPQPDVAAGRRRAGLAWDPACLAHQNVSGLTLPIADSWLAVRPSENPERLLRCVHVLRASGRLDLLTPVALRVARDEDLLLVHTRAHIDAIRSTRTFPEPRRIAEFASAGAASWHAALTAAGATLASADAVIEGELACAYALVRPPGHHATAAAAMGFCLFNNVAIAARHLQAHHGVGRVAILDWDVHHGNGTEDIFIDDPSVLVISIHQEELFPPARGDVGSRGRGAGVGATVNIPLPAGSGDAAYEAAFEHVIEPALRIFAPEFVLVSAGQDAAATDPLGRMSASAELFRTMTARVLGLAAEVCDGRVVLVQEGGYSVDHAPWCLLAIVEALLGVEPSLPEDPIPADRPLQLGWREREAVERASGTLAFVPHP